MSELKQKLVLWSADEDNYPIVLLSCGHVVKFKKPFHLLSKELECPKCIDNQLLHLNKKAGRF